MTPQATLQPAAAAQATPAATSAAQTDPQTTAQAQAVDQAKGAAQVAQGASDSIALCVTVKDQAADVREWVLHHQRLGVETFYIYDHNSQVPLITELYDLVDQGVVVYTYYREFQHITGYPQAWVFDTCLNKYRDKHRWMGFWDTDEFLIINAPDKNLHSALVPYDGFSGVAINVRMFGTSGHLTRPGGKTVNNYKACFPLQHEDNKHIKVFVHPADVARSGPTPHNFFYLPGKFAVNAKMQRTDGFKTEDVDRDVFIIHHYATKSREEFERHMMRGSAHGHNIKTIEFLEWADKESTVTCADALEPEAT